MTLTWKTTDADEELLTQISLRAHKLLQGVGIHYELLDLQMDLTAVHLNGCPLRLADMLASRDTDLAHDIGGIRRHLDRETGKLGGHFLPRFAAPEGGAH